MSYGENKYDGFDDRQDVWNEFNRQVYSTKPSEPDADFPTDDEIIAAWYDTPPYEGQAFVLYQRDGKLFEVNAGHCSCMGLEDQWDPEETSIGALKMRTDTYCFGNAIKDLATKLEAEGV